MVRKRLLAVFFEFVRDSVQDFGILSRQVLLVHVDVLLEKRIALHTEEQLHEFGIDIAAAPKAGMLRKERVGLLFVDQLAEARKVDDLRELLVQEVRNLEAVGLASRTGGSQS